MITVEIVITYKNSCDVQVTDSKLWICIAHCREHASNAVPLPVSRRWSPLASPFSQAFSKQLKTMDTGWCVTRCACLLSQLSSGSLLILA